MSTQSRLRQSARDAAAGRTKPAASKRKPGAYKPAAVDVTAFQKAAHRQALRKPHEISATKGGKIPGIPFGLRKFPHGKPEGDL